MAITTLCNSTTSVAIGDLGIKGGGILLYEGARPGTRTRTVAILSRLPLPIGLDGQDT